MMLTWILPFRSPEEIKNQANEQYKQGRYEEAVKLYSQAIGKWNSLL